MRIISQISLPGPTGAVLAILADGVCKNTSDGADATCGVIDPSKYEDLWAGRTQMDSMSASPVTADFTSGKPTKSELCLNDFETCLDISGK